MLGRTFRGLVSCVCSKVFMTPMYAKQHYLSDRVEQLVNQELELDFGILSIVSIMKSTNSF
jgi:hypothetical protein